MQVFNKLVADKLPMNADFTSDFVPLKNMYMYSIAGNVVGVPNGSIRLQASNDPETNTSVPLATPRNWVDITNSPFTVISEGRVMWNVSAIAYNYVRVAYTDISGGSSAATVTLVFNGKGA